jgi:hypothetical protein
MKQMKYALFGGLLWCGVTEVNAADAAPLMTKSSFDVKQASEAYIMTDKQLYAASMENDAQFIECVGNIFFAVAGFQRVILEDLKWESSNSEFQNIDKARKSFEKASGNLSAALNNSDKLLGELSGEKKRKFELQLTGFKSQIKNLNARIGKVIQALDNHELPKIEEIHQLVSMAIAGTGYGMDVSRKHAVENTGR